MRKRSHLAFFLLGIVLFIAYCYQISMIYSSEWYWYQLPLYIPIQAGLFFGMGGEDVSQSAVNVVWALECLAAGAVFDLLVSWFRRLIRGASSKTSEADIKRN